MITELSDMNKKLLILLGISLALNCGFIGYFAARPCRSIPPQRARFMPKPKHHGEFDFMKQAFKDNESRMRQAHRAIGEAFKTEDPDKIKTAFAAADEVRHQIDEQVQSAIIERFMKMSADERADFLRRFDRKGRPARPRRGNREFLPPPPPPPMPPEEADD